MAAQPRGGERNIFDCQFIFREVKIIRDKQLGNGAYGAVFRAQCDSLLCAAKCIHTVLFDDPDPEARRYQRDLFYKECEIMAGMKHPNIVQFLGYYEDRDNNDQPCLLMELLDESLFAYLERHLKEGRHVPFHTSIDFAHDVSMALDYLHKNLRMHCDLTSNNILILAGTRAKVTDFGQSVLVLPEYDFRVKGIQCPGTMCYMPPEALKADPIYDSSLDTFSFGVVLIQILTREFPAPSSSTKIIEGFGPGGSDAILPVKEKDRRSLHIALINPNHPLLTIALCCIEDDNRLRPPFTILTDQLTALKAMPEYEESRKENPGTSRPQLHDNWSPVNESRINDLEKKIDQLEKYNGLLQGQVAQMEFAIQKKDTIIEQLLDQQRMGGGGGGGGGGGARPFGHDTTPTGSLTSGGSLSSNPSSLPTTPQALPVPELKVGNKTLRWYPCSRLPSGLYSGSALCIKDKVYVSGQGLTAIFEYDPQKNVWLKLPDSPTASFALVAIRGVLAIVGGYTTQAYSNAVYSLVTVGNENKWTSTYPPMQDPRINPGAVVTNEYLIVAGGEIQAPRNRFLSWNVEMLHIDSKVWQTVDKLPRPVKRISMAISENHVYVVGGITRNNQPLKEMFHTSLADLVNSATSNFASRAFRSGTCWGSIAVPQVYSTLAILSGQVVLIGGWDNQPSLSIHAMNVDPRTRQISSWSPVGKLPLARFDAMATVLSGNRLMVIGGRGNIPGKAGEQVLDAAEIAIPVA